MLYVKFLVTICYHIKVILLVNSSRLPIKPNNQPSAKKNTSNQTDKQPRRQLWYPKYWATWCGLGILRLFALFPYAAQLALGRTLGRLIRLLTPKRYKVTLKNIELCFPELSPTEQEQRADAHFSALGIGLLEVGMCWWWPSRRLQDMAEIRGLEHLDQAQAKGNGVLLLSGHFTTLEVSGRLLTLERSIDAMFRPHRNAVIAWAMQHFRGTHAGQAIPRNDLRAMLRALRNNRAIWYAPDQSKAFKGNVLAPFFTEPAVSNTATAKLAKITGAAVVPFYGWRKPEGGYVLELLPALENFPSGDDKADATRVNAVIEQAVRKAPEQYLWVHERFKQRGEGLPDIYADL